MTKRIFVYIFLITLVVFLSVSLVFFGLAYYAIGATILDVLYVTLLPILCLFLLTMLFAFLTAKKLSGKILGPINAIDLEHPEEAVVYDELKPIVDRLCRQKYKIAKQMRELSLRRNEFASMTANMTDGLVVINSRGDILSSNRSARSILGLGAMPKSILEISMTSSLRLAVLSALSGENGRDTTKHGGRSYSILATPVMRDEEEVEGALLVFLDTTERDEREELRREFTANVSHELKTPLTSISGFAEIIRDGIAEGEDAKKFAGNIYKEADRLITLVGDIIRLAEVDGGEIAYDEGEIDLSEIAESVRESLSDVANRAGVDILTSLAHAPICGNRQILGEMIYNLVDNGIKYTDRGGYVRITVEVREDKPTLIVEDNGIGIPEEAQSRVFERFYRVDKSHSKLVGGTGLGLSIVKHAAVYHKAEIKLESTPGEGTKIKITFPAP